MDFNYTLASNGDGTGTLELFTVNTDGSATQGDVYTLSEGDVAFLSEGLAAIENDPLID